MEKEQIHTTSVRFQAESFRTYNIHQFHCIPPSYNAWNKSFNFKAPPPPNIEFKIKNPHCDSATMNFSNQIYNFNDFSGFIELTNNSDFRLILNCLNQINEIISTKFPIQSKVFKILNVLYSSDNDKQDCLNVFRRAFVLLLFKFHRLALANVFLF